MSVEANRLKWPMISWGGPRFTRSPANILANGVWTGGTASDTSAPNGLGGNFGFTGGGFLNFNAAALFSWVPLGSLPFVRTGKYELDITGLTPGSQFGWNSSLGWIVNQAANNSTFWAATIGATTKEVRLPESSSILVSGISDPNYLYQTIVVPLSGTVTIRIRAQANPSFNAVWQFGPLVYGEVGIGPRKYKLLCPFYPEDFRSYSQPSDDHTELAYPSGFRDGWDVAGSDRMLEFTPRAIPWYGRDVPSDTWWGWDGEGGWREFLQSFADGNPFDFYPDQDDDTTCYTMAAVSPREAKFDADWVWHRKQRLIARTVDRAVPVAGY